MLSAVSLEYLLRYLKVRSFSCLSKTDLLWLSMPWHMEYASLLESAW